MTEKPILYRLDRTLQPVPVYVDDLKYLDLSREAWPHLTDVVTYGRKKYYISTVWLGIDHNFSDGGPPLLWETMVFEQKKGKSGIELYSKRYSSSNDAIHGHQMAVGWVMDGGPSKL